VKGRMVNVGVDVWGFRPIPEPALMELLRMAGVDQRLPPLPPRAEGPRR
jgi:calcineurin-like phosphoesterase family protein